MDTHFHMNRVTKKLAALTAAFAVILSAALSLPETPVRAVTGTWNYGYSAVCTSASQIDTCFPESYASSLKALLSVHPNWRFRAFYTGLKWEDCFLHDDDYSLDTEMLLSRNLIEYGSMPSSWYGSEVKGAFNWAGNHYTVLSAPNWVQASEEAIRYMMDPRNWMNEEQIFQFMDQTAPSSEAAVRQVFTQVQGSNYWVRSGERSDVYWDETAQLPAAGHFDPLDDAAAGDAEAQFAEYRHFLTYAEALVKIGVELQVNPVALATRIINEQGLGDTPLINGTQGFTLDTGEPVNGGYYNYFNMEATDGAEGASMDLIITNGLREAYNNGWNTRYRALYGGAAKYAARYIFDGQATIYQQKFSVDSRSDKLFWHQYMQAILAPMVAARASYASYCNAGILDDRITFLIPVYDEMPDRPEPCPVKDGNPNYKLGAIYVNDDSVPDFDTDVLDYSMEVRSGNAHLYIAAYADTSSITAGEASGYGSLAADVALEKGENIIPVTCTAENGDSRTYVLHISWTKTVYYGDINYDGTVDDLDMNLLIDYILGRAEFNEDMLEAADINGDGLADINDLSFIVAYILGNIEEIPQR